MASCSCSPGGLWRCMRHVSGQSDGHCDSIKQITSKLMLTVLDISRPCLLWRYTCGSCMQSARLTPESGYHTQFLRGQFWPKSCHTTITHTRNLP